MQCEATALVKKRWRGCPHFPALAGQGDSPCQTAEEVAYAYAVQDEPSQCDSVFWQRYTPPLGAMVAFVGALPVRFLGLGGGTVQGTQGTGAERLAPCAVQRGSGRYVRWAAV